MTRRARDAVDPDLHNPGDALEEFIRAHCNARDVEDGLRLVADLTAELTEMGEASRDELGARRELGPRDRLGARDIDATRYTAALPGAAEDAVLGMDAAPDSRTGRAARDVAIERTAPHVGRHVVLACDSAKAVYRAALAELGVATRGMHAHALMPTFAAAVRQQHGTPGGDLRHGGLPRPAATLANDDRGFRARFPAVAGVRSLG